MALCAIRPTWSPSMFGTTPWSLRSRPEQNARPDPGEHDHPGVVLLGDLVEGVVELDDELDRHRVEPIRAVHLHHRDVRAAGAPRARRAGHPPWPGTVVSRVGWARFSRSAQQGDLQMADEPQSGATIEDYLVEDRTFPPPEEFKEQTPRRVTVPLRRGRRGLAGLLGQAGRRAARLGRGVAHDPRVGPPVRQVVRRRQAQRLPQRRRPPRRRGPRRQGRVPLGGRARRHPHHHLRRPATPRCSASPTC